MQISVNWLLQLILMERNVKHYIYLLSIDHQLSKLNVACQYSRNSAREKCGMEMHIVQF